MRQLYEYAPAITEFYAPRLRAQRTAGLRDNVYISLYFVVKSIGLTVCHVFSCIKKMSRIFASVANNRIK